MNRLNPELEIPISSCRRNLFAIATVFLIVLSVYSNTFHSSWHLDDSQNILGRKEIHLKNLQWAEIKKSFFKENRRLYRPVACFSFAINYYLGKKDVFGYHLVNISIHILASIFLFAFIYNILNLPLLKAKYGPNSYFISLMAAVLWAINPVQTQAVTYIVQRMASMAGMFCIMAMYFYLKGRTSRDISFKVFHYSIFSVSAILAFGSKENAAMLPISILLFDLFLVQGLTRKNVIKNLYMLLVLIVIPLFIALMFKGPSFLHPNNLISGYQGRPFTLPERLLTEPRIIIFYISLLLYPMPGRLSIAHNISVSHSLFDPITTILSILIIPAIIGFAVLKARKWPLISYCILFFFLNHLIESTIFPLELVFEHRNYLPSMLFFVPFSFLAWKGISYFSYKKSMRFILVAFIILVLIGLGHSTFMRNFIWNREVSLWIDATEKAPNLFRPWHNLGNAYSSLNKREVALSCYRKALTKKSINQKGAKCLTFFDMAFEYHKMGKLDKALHYYQSAESVNPSFADSYNNKGALLLSEGLIDEARQELEKAIKYDKKHSNAYSNLGRLLLRKGEIDGAIEALKKAIKFKPDERIPLRDLGYAYRVKGCYGKAFLIFNKALNIKPADPKVFLYLSEIYFKNRKNSQGEKFIKKFLDSGKRIHLRDYTKGIAEEKEKSIKIKNIKKPVLKSLFNEYYDNVSLIYENTEGLNVKKLKGLYQCD